MHVISGPDPVSHPSSPDWVECLKQFELEITDHAPGSVYVYDRRDQYTVQASSSIAAVLGYATEEMTALEPNGLASLIHPDDLDRVADSYQRLTTLRVGETLVVEYRMRRADETWCWLRSQETLLATAKADFPAQVLGFVQAITAHRSTSGI
ncbi:MAG: PAS domain-containing protein [Leptolyngbyaceae cyanobacterium bins.349]|nr:PAS domain-containing protein [Leptolyngbyaceae cyanobacterium bins.349]